MNQIINGHVECYHDETLTLCFVLISLPELRSVVPSTVQSPSQVPTAKYLQPSTYSQVTVSLKYVVSLGGQVVGLFPVS